MEEGQNYGEQHGDQNHPQHHGAIAADESLTAARIFSIQTLQ